MARSVFVLGGARSGKSRHAQQRAEALPGRHFFIATAQAYDDEMCERIAHHRADRDMRWTTVEAPFELPGAVAANDAADAVILIDCLTLWASNLLLQDADAEQATGQLCRTIAAAKGQVILVANEVGSGIVPDNVLARRFRDIAGRMNQAVAATADEVLLVTAGLSLRLK